MARPRRIATPQPPPSSVSATGIAREVRLLRHFVAATFERVVDATPVVRFYDVTGSKVLNVELTPDADKIWRRMNGGR